MYRHISSGLGRSEADALPARPLRAGKVGVGLFRAIAQMGRMRAVPALLTPVLWGAATARWQIETVSIWPALALLFDFAALAPACNFLGAYVDYRRHLNFDTLSHAPESEQKPPLQSRSLPFDGYDWMQQGLLRAATFLSLGLMAGTIFALASLWLGFFVGWPFCFFALLSGLMCGASIWAPIRYARRLWWLGDIAYWLGMGVFPLLGTYFALTGAVTQPLLWIAFAPATFAWLAYLSFSFYSWHRDWRIRRRTLVVVFGPDRGLDIAAIISVVGFIALILLMATGAVPVWTILVLGAFPLFLRAFARGRVWPFSRQAGIATVENAINGVVLAGLLWLIPLWLA